jgi:hypothetical protein
LSAAWSVTTGRLKVVTIPVNLGKLLSVRETILTVKSEFEKLAYLFLYLILYCIYVLEQLNIDAMDMLKIIDLVCVRR